MGRVEKFRQEEYKEPLPLGYAKTVFVTGAGLTKDGRPNTALQTLQMLPLGQNRILSSRAIDRFQASHATLDNPETVYPLITDLNDIEATTRLIRANAHFFSEADILYFAAGGMESFGRDVLVRVNQLSRVKQQTPELYQAQLDRLKTDIHEWQKQAVASRAYDINYEVPVHLLDATADVKDPNEPNWWIFGSSIPSTFFPEMFSDEVDTRDPAFAFNKLDTPDFGFSFYKEVARSKHNFEMYLKFIAPKLLEQGIFPVVISGHLLKDTSISTFVKATNKLVPPEEQLNISACPTMADMAAAADQILSQRPTPDFTSEWPARLYVLEHGLITPEPPSIEDLWRMRLPL